MDILQKATSGYDANEEIYRNSPADDDSTTANKSNTKKKLESVAEEKLVSFCEQVLREASDMQSSVEETTDMDIHRVLELRSPIIVKVHKFLLLQAIQSRACWVVVDCL